MTSAFGGQHSIQLSYGCVRRLILYLTPGRKRRKSLFRPLQGRNADKLGPCLPWLTKPT